MIGAQLGLYLALIYAGLILFGLGYNDLVGWAETKKYIEGYVSDAVAVGVALTILPFALLPGSYPAWQVIVFITGGFVASGLPMMIGSRVRHARARHDEQQTTRLAE